MSYELTGKLIEIYDVVQVNDTFRKREFVVQKEEQVNDRVFVDTIKFQATQDRCSLLDDMSFGDEVTVTFNIKGRKWEKDGKVSYFNNLEAFKLLRVASSGAGSSVSNKPASSERPLDSAPDPVGDIPF